MTRLLTLSAAIALSVSVSQPLLAQGKGHDKPGKDKGEAPAHAQARGDHPGKGGDKNKSDDRQGRGDRAGYSDQPGRGNDRRDGPAAMADSGPSRERDRDREWDRTGERHVVYAPYRDHGALKGCPPGLAKKGNGCLPPGQAKKIERERHELAWRAPVAGVTYRYDDGYQYRYDRQGSLLGYLPALGGVLGVGNIWPTQYSFDAPPAYQRDYFGLTQPYDYRYADGALYAVDARTSAIQQVVALLTGQSANVGQRMPPGFDIYNVPYAYRDQYVDSAAAAYRYNDGAIYQLDPTTQVVQAIIQLLT